MKLQKHIPRKIDASKLKKIPKMKKEREGKKNIGKSRKSPKTLEFGLQISKLRALETLPLNLVMYEEITLCEEGKCKWFTKILNKQELHVERFWILIWQIG